MGSESWSYHVGSSSKVNPSVERWQQFYALLLKRFHHSKRNLKALLTHILLPAVFISIAMTVALSQPKANTYPKLVLSPTMFHPPPYYIPFSNSNPNNNLSRRMAETLSQPSGVCSDCVLKSPNMTLPAGVSMQHLRKNLRRYYDPFCAKQVGKKFNMELPASISNSERTGFNDSLFCNCSKNWIYQCDQGVEGRPETFNTVTMDTMENIEGRDFQTYLLYTNDKYRRKR